MSFKTSHDIVVYEISIILLKPTCLKGRSQLKDIVNPTDTEDQCENVSLDLRADSI